MPYLVKIFKDDNGEEVSVEYQVWHLIYNLNGNQTFCGGEYFGCGESAVVFKTKFVKRGGITCKKCLEKIKEIKAIKL